MIAVPSAYSRPVSHLAKCAAMMAICFSVTAFAQTGLVAPPADSPHWLVQSREKLSRADDEASSLLRDASETGNVRTMTAGFELKTQINLASAYVEHASTLDDYHETLQRGLPPKTITEVFGASLKCGLLQVDMESQQRGLQRDLRRGVFKSYEQVVALMHDSLGLAITNCKAIQAKERAAR